MEIRVLETNFVAIDLIEDSESVLWIERYSEAGEFELVTKPTERLLTLLVEDRYLQIKDSEVTMIIESVQIKTNLETGDQLIVKGRGLSSIMDRRIILGQTVIDDSLQDGIFTIMDNNIITSSSQPHRAIPNFLFITSSDPLVTTPTLKDQYDSQYVYDIIKFLCDKHSLGFKVTLNASNQFEFRLYAGADRSYDQTTNPYVIFSPKFDNLKSSNYFRTKRFYKTIGFILADGYNFDPRPGVDFDPWENDPDDPNYYTLRTGLDRREFFLNDPELILIDPLTGLPFPGGPTGLMTWIMYERVRIEMINNYSVFNAFDGEAESSVNFVYNEDYFLGDIVQIEDKYGNKGRARITEVVISENISGTGIYPKFTMI